MLGNLNINDKRGDSNNSYLDYMQSPQGFMSSGSMSGSNYYKDSMSYLGQNMTPSSEYGYYGQRDMYNAYSGYMDGMGGINQMNTGYGYLNNQSQMINPNVNVYNNKGNYYKGGFDNNNGNDYFGNSYNPYILFLIL
jgi:hypothetical protein